jgi:hypothetical protein
VLLIRGPFSSRWVPALRSSAKSAAPRPGHQLEPPHLATRMDFRIQISNSQRHTSAFPRRKMPELCEVSLSPKQRAQGMPGAWCARSRAWCVESTRVSHHGHTETPGIPRAMVLTAYSVLSPVTGLCCHRHPWILPRDLNASVGASGPHGFAVRSHVIRLVTPPRPSHPAPNVRDDRDTPLL